MNNTEILIILEKKKFFSIAIFCLIVANKGRKKKALHLGLYYTASEVFSLAGNLEALV